MNLWVIMTSHEIDSNSSLSSLGSVHSSKKSEKSNSPLGSERTSRKSHGEPGSSSQSKKHHSDAHVPHRQQHTSTSKALYRQQLEAHKSCSHGAGCEKPPGRYESEEDLYRLDEGSKLWRTYDGSVIYWEIHKLTYTELSEALWSWAEEGLDQAQKLCLANLRPPHAGHRLGLLDFFCPHRTKLIRDHIRRIYSDLYLILRTWAELKHYIDQLGQNSAPQANSKTLKKIENRLTFYFMVAFREYSGLPLDPKHPDKPSWPARSEKNFDSQPLESEALAYTHNARPTSNASVKSSSTGRESGSKAICSHCHQILEAETNQQTVERVAKPFETSLITCNQSELSECSEGYTIHTLSSRPSESSAQKEKQNRSGSQTSEGLSTTSNQREILENSRTGRSPEHSHTGGSARHKSKRHEHKSSPAKEKGKKSTSNPSSHSDRLSSSAAMTRKTSHSHGKESGKSKDDTDNESLIKFDPAEFSNMFGAVFHLP